MCVSYAEAKADKASAESAAEDAEQATQQAEQEEKESKEDAGTAKNYQTTALSNICWPNFIPPGGLATSAGRLLH